VSIITNLCCVISCCSSPCTLCPNFELRGSISTWDLEITVFQRKIEEKKKNCPPGHEFDLSFGENTCSNLIQTFLSHCNEDDELAAGLWGNVQPCRLCALANMRYQSNTDIYEKLNQSCKNWFACMTNGDDKKTTEKQKMTAT